MNPTNATESENLSSEVIAKSLSEPSISVSCLVR